MLKHFSRVEKILYALLAVNVILLLVNCFCGETTILTKITLGINAFVFGCMTGIYSTRKRDAKESQ